MRHPVSAGNKGRISGWRFVRARLCYLICLTSLLVGMLPASAAQAAPARQIPTGPVNPAAAENLAHCADLQPAAMRDELNRISQDIFAEGETGIDLDVIVAAEWNTLRLDATIDQAVADAVAQARSRRDWLETFLSGWSATQAEALTQEIAGLAFGSATFSQAIDQLAEAVAQAVAAEFAALSVESTAETMLCLQAYIGGRYSESFVVAFAEEIRAGAAQADLDMDEQLDTGLLTILGQHRAALGGVGVIIAGQVAGRIVQRIGQDLARRVAGRIAGRVLGRVGAAVIPAVGWVVGIGLLVYDLAEGRDGALPQIQTSLQSAAVKDAIRAEIVLAVEPELRLAAPQVAREIADELNAEWLDFQRKYQQVLALAGDNPQFRALLSDVTDVGHLASLVDVLLSDAGEPGIAAALASGDLQRLLGLPPESVEILRTRGEIAPTLAWANLAGGQLDQVVRLEIYKHKSPQELDRDTLMALLALDDPSTVAKLVLLESHEMGALLELAGATLGDVTARLAAPELAWLARYIDEMSPTQANQLVMQVLQTPTLMTRLQNDGLAELLLRTEDLTGALAFLANPPSVQAFPGDLWAILTGQTAFRLFTYKYGWGITLGFAAGATLVILAITYSFVLWLIAPLRALVRIVGAPFRRRSGTARNG